MEAGTSPTLVVEREIHIEASPETVFEFFTDPSKIVRWKGASATVDPRPGGVMRVEMNSEIVISGEYVEIDPPHRLVYTWGWEGGFAGTPPGSSTVEFTFTPVDGGTLLHLVHTGFTTEEAAKAHGEGWDVYLPRLVIAATGGDAGPDPNAAKED